MSYSMDMRKRVIAVYEDKKMTQKKISENFGISLSTIKRWLTRTRSGESLIPKTFNSGRPGKIDVSGLETLKNIVKEYPSITLAELSKLYAKKHKIVVGKSVLSRALQALNLRHKKLSVTAFEKENDAVKKKTEEYWLKIRNIPAKNLVFLDEAGAHLQMVPRYGRAYGKDRAIFSAPYQHGNQITMISAISLDGIEASLYGEWAANTEIFVTFIEKCLCPKLKPHHVVVMDNVGFHKSEKIKSLIYGCQAEIVFLPPYSPELNPIEEMWSKIKNSLRRQCARNIKKFNKAIKIAYKSITNSDLFGWFKHAGY